MYHVHVARQVGFNLECPEVADFLFALGVSIGYHNGRRYRDDQISVSMTHWARARIPQARNEAVREAREIQATHLLFIDPDMVVDAHVGKASWAKKFWNVAWPFILQHPCSVVAAPYCGAGDPPRVHVYGLAQDNQWHAYLPDAVANLSGWKNVECVGTGLMLIDMSVFGVLESENPNLPFFDDVYSDTAKTQLVETPDQFFCRRLLNSSVPLYVNFDCWCAHWQNQRVVGPRPDHEALLETQRCDGAADPVVVTDAVSEPQQSVLPDSTYSPCLHMAEEASWNGGDGVHPNQGSVGVAVASDSVAGIEHTVQEVRMPTV